MSEFSVINVNGKQQMATPLNLISQDAHKSIAYLGSKDRYVRGIPVRQWLLCTQLTDSDLTLQIVISYSSYPSFSIQ